MQQSAYHNSAPTERASEDRTNSERTQGQANSLPKFGLTVFTKTDGPLTKKISLGDDGTVVSDGSECRMARGHARRAHFSGLAEFAEFISALGSNEAIGWGQLRADLADSVTVTTKSKLNGGSAIARTRDFISPRIGQPAVLPLDFDTKGMPAEVAERMNAAGGFWPALVSVLPRLTSAEHVVRASTSAGLSRTDTGEQFKGSGGAHVYLLALDGADVERFVQDAHARCWLAGFGWMMVGAGGQLLERSIVDRMVAAPSVSGSRARRPWCRRSSKAVRRGGRG